MLLMRTFSCARRVAAAPCSVRRLHARCASSLGSVLVFSNVLPRPSASAAGARTSYILKQLCRDSDWTSVHYASGAARDNENEAVQDLEKHGVMFHSVPPNRSSNIQDFLTDIGKDLSLVIFYRFYTEEAYSFHVYKHCPEAVRVIDMQDMHSLRQGRQALVKANKDSWSSCMRETIQYCPSYDNPLLLRELASLNRSELSLVCSPFEQDLLTNVYKMPSNKLCLAPFWVESDINNTVLSYEERQDFCFIGGFRHPPNVDAVHQLRNVIWPRIQDALPNACLHIYGAYCPPQVHALHDESSGFLVHGFATSLHEALAEKRVLLAPLRYGAGIKGKVLDAWSHGLPVITTPIGSEGIKSKEGEWGGVVAEDIDQFVEGAIHHYSDPAAWDTCTRHATSILSTQFGETQWANVVAKALKDAVRNRDERRRQDFVASMLWHQSARSTEYFSRWIECKESKDT